jgi:prepilin-type N-terminal cleavage/methylation domain-containing protein
VPHRNSGATAGFTLIEVMVSLVVSAIVLLGARAMLGEVGDAAARISAESARLDTNANAERALRVLVRNLDLGYSNEAVFAGDVRRVTFVSWCDTPSGWQERCKVALTIEKRQGGDALVVQTSRSDAIIVRDRVRNGSLRYLTTVYGGGEWIRTWGAGITAPLAIGIILDSDTLIVPIGERG